MSRRLETSIRPFAAVLAALCLTAAACTTGDTQADPTTTQPQTTLTTASQAESTDTTAGDPDNADANTNNSLASTARLQVALVFSYHQPYLPETNGAIELSSARLSAARNYLDLAQLLNEFPTANASLAISGPTIQQLEALTNPRGAQRTVDRHHLMTSTPLQDLTPDDRQFILNNFFQGT